MHLKVPNDCHFFLLICHPFLCVCVQNVSERLEHSLSYLFIYLFLFQHTMPLLIRLYPLLLDYPDYAKMQS